MHVCLLCISICMCICMLYICAVVWMCICVLAYGCGGLGLMLESPEPWATYSLIRIECSSCGLLYLVLYTAEGRFSGGGWARLIYEPSRCCQELLYWSIPLAEQDYLFLSLNCCLSSLSFFTIWAMSTLGFISWSGPSFQAHSGCLLPQRLCHYCTSTTCRLITILGHRVCNWVGVCHSPLVVCRVPSSTVNNCH